MARRTASSRCAAISASSWTAIRQCARRGGASSAKDEIKKKQRGTIPYSFKAQRLLSEFHIGRSLFQETGPIVKMYDLLEVRWPFARLGVKVGYDLIWSTSPVTTWVTAPSLRSLSLAQKLDFLPPDRGGPPLRP